LQRHQFFRNQFGRVQVIERQFVRFVLREYLNCQFPLGEVTLFDSLEHVTALEVRISPGDLYGFIPDRGLQAQLGPPVKFDEGGIA
jgi:hypothetical protein